MVGMGKRKMLAADERLAEQIVKIAEERGQTLFSLVNEVLEQAMRVHDMGLTLRQVVDEWSKIEAVRSAGLMFCVKSLWFDVIERVFSLEKNSMVEKWRETGSWYGKYFITKETDDPFRGFMDFVRNLMWGATEFVIDLDDCEGRVRCMSADFPASYTELLSAFLEGAIGALGYECVEKDFSKGILQITFKKIK